MRRLLILALLTVGCGARALASAPATATATASPTPPTPATTATPRTTTPPARDCQADFVHSARTIGDLVAASDIVVRASAVTQDIAQLRPGLGPRATRDARRTVLRVDAVLRTNGPRPDEVRVLEDVCPNLDVVAGEQWILFLRAYDPTGHGPDDGRDYWVSVAGPKSQIRLASGVVTGPFWRFAGAVNALEGATVADVEAVVR